MFIAKSRIKFKDDFDRIQAFFIMHMGLFLCAKAYEYLRYEFSVLSFIGFILWIVFYRIFYRMLSFVHYTFWTMAAFVVAFMVTDLYSSLQTYSDISLFYFYFFSLIALCFAAYNLNNPIYYPIVSWWEYDFRYRNDIVTKVKYGESDYEEGRLIDLRKYAGGLSYFKDLKIGDEVILAPEYNELDMNFKATIISKRQHSLGRPYTYGIKFHFGNEEEQKAFVRFQKFWQFERKHKQNAKFKNS